MIRQKKIMEEMLSNLAITPFNISNADFYDI